MQIQHSVSVIEQKLVWKETSFQSYWIVIWSELREKSELNVLPPIEKEKPNINRDDWMARVMKWDWGQFIVYTVNQTKRDLIKIIKLLIDFSSFSLLSFTFLCSVHWFDYDQKLDFAFECLLVCTYLLIRREEKKSSK